MKTVAMIPARMGSQRLKKKNLAPCVGSCVSVQGLFVKALDGGRIVVRVGERMYEGLPVA